MSKFCPLFSSSKGNSIFLSCAGTSLLIDAGVSFRRLCAALDAQGFSIEDIDAVLITHEHSDHIGGLKTLTRKTNIPIYASRGTLEYLWVNGYISARAPAFETDDVFSVGDIEVRAFDTPHDAAHSLGFRFTMPDSRTAAVATDLGHISDTVRESLAGCDLIMLESNYDKGMLECSSYPYPLIRRIKSDYGHLSNDGCSRELISLAKSGATRFVLGHLSEQNNMPELARETSRAALTAAGLKENRDYTLAVAPPRGETSTIIF